MTPPFIIVFELGNPFFSRLTIQKFISWVLLESMLPRPLLCRSYLQEKSNLNKPSIESSICSYKFSTMSAFPESVLNHFILLSTSNMLLILLIFSKSQPSFSLTEFSAKFKCQTQFQHCFNICYSLVFQHILSGVSTYDSALCFNIYYSLVFQHILTVVFQHKTQHCVSAYTTAWCFNIYSQRCFSI
jgi:hypothetical protein